MSIFRPDACIARWVNAQRLFQETLSNCVLCAYTTDRVWLAADDTANATAIEATFGGYVRKTITDWDVASVTGNLATTLAGLYTWTATGAGLPITIYGIFVLNSAGNLLYVEKNPTGGVVLSAAGHTFSYRPAWSDKNL